ncbi:phosphoribosylformimino-5-aminoimidazole carboxamide ribotide isomerase [Methylovorus glucosotrophus]|uniref:HisA/HisF-related TIM barrel protein n=1 Tax=Methylovorus glucosotrophus TaxID=266009 RepID=UPI0013313120|nr:HisA/HisF-related TIM barrel protein [Methylovorus glucosotrophus]KAF0843873.1 phosphoribosylformimino-5-aminoimidazole carboxamide ribotide isomerase [Methylovorus glucosotrophus]
MNIIPVIDLLEHHVVHAKRGERQHYRPIESGLCDSSEPLAITRALLELYPFDTLYIADLNAIQGKPAHVDEIALIRQHYPQLRIWLDAGFKNTRDLLPWSGLEVTPVIGSESLPDIGAYQELISEGVAHVLSLDFRGDRYQGPEALLDNPRLWPQQVIGMTLAHVGSNQGPDHARLQQLISMAQHGKLYGAGGVRDINDLQRLREQGIAGALVASALHSGQISSQDIARISV